MSPILNQAGTYELQVPVVPETVEVDASELPQIKPDVYADVDHRDFSSAVSMSRVQQLTMAAIAHSRGDSEAAARWKMQAHQRVLDEERAAEAERMNDMLAPQAPVHHTGPLAEVKSDVPWENDAAYLELAREREEVAAKLEATPDLDDDYFTLAGKQAVLDDHMATRKAEILEAAAASGMWTEQDQRVLAARQSLTEKAATLAPHTALAEGEGEAS